jgi:hypothetical protein
MSEVVWPFDNKRVLTKISTTKLVSSEGNNVLLIHKLLHMLCCANLYNAASHDQHVAASIMSHISQSSVAPSQLAAPRSRACDLFLLQPELEEESLPLSLELQLCFNRYASQSKISLSVMPLPLLLVGVTCVPFASVVGSAVGTAPEG